MRYDNWDVILFPKDSAVPIQEFRTACYISQDDHGRQLPTLTCYIASLPKAAPFRVSIHSWATPAKPSALIESRRRNTQKVVYATQVIVDGARLFHGFYDCTSRWPQEITNEKPSITDPQEPSTQRGRFLEFPPFNQNVLMQRAWDAREHNGRIKVLLSEQLVGKNSSPGKLDLGIANDIVCFAFQHAPQDILEQAGISWPIHNPLYLASGIQGPSIPQVPAPHVKPRDLNVDRARSSLSQHSPSLSAWPRSSDPYARPRTDPPPHLSQFPKPTMGPKAIRPGFWDSNMADSFSGSYDDMSMDSWSTSRTGSHSTADTTMPDLLYASPIFGQSGDPWNITGPTCGPGLDRAGEGKPTRREKGTRQVMVTLRDDQLGQLIEAFSPPKKGRGREHLGQHLPSGSFLAQTSAPGPPPKIPGLASAHPSAAALARKASYPDLQQKKPNKVSPDKENQTPSRTQDAQLSANFFHANRVPTPHPFVVPQAQMSTWDSDVSMRDTSSIFSNQPLLEKSRSQMKDSKNSPAPIPAASGSIKSRKEGINPSSINLPGDNRHDQSLLPEFGSMTQHENIQNAPKVTSPHPRIEDIIDIDAVDAVDKVFVPGHKSGMSSLDSTGRLERKLYSALGEELSFHVDADQMGAVQNEGISDLTNLEDLEAPVVKRKRQDTFGGERDRSPIAKMARDANDNTNTRQSPLPHMRGGE